MPTQIDLTFPQAYVVEEIQDLPGGPPSRMFYMPSGSQTSGRDGICLKISPRKGAPWIGMFAFSVLGNGEMNSGVYGCPDGESLCVVSLGEGYVVRADDPTKCDVVPTLPILGVRAVKEAKLLVFWDFTAIAAWGTAGLAWRTERVCIDELQVEEITSSSLKGSGWDPVNNNRSKFEVELHTGEILSRTGAVLP
jgi:hypothetical protein